MLHEICIQTACSVTYLINLRLNKLHAKQYNQNQDFLH